VNTLITKSWFRHEAAYLQREYACEPMSIDMELAERPDDDEFALTVREARGETAWMILAAWDRLLIAKGF